MTFAIGSIYDDKGEYNKALEWHFKALSILKRVSGTDHHSIGMTYSDISRTYFCMGNYDKAEEYQKKRDESWEEYRKKRDESW